MAFLYPDLRWHIFNMKWLRVCQSCIIPFASQCHGGLSERTGDERISFGAILSTGSFGRLDVSKPQICGVQLPYLCVLNKKSGDFWFTASNRFFFRLQEMVETLLAANASVDLSRSDGATALILASQVWGSMGLMGLVDLVGPKVGGWESLGSHLRKSSFSNDFRRDIRSKHIQQWFVNNI